MHKTSDIIYETERLFLRNWREEDVDPFLEHLNTPAVMRWLGPLHDRDMILASCKRHQSYAEKYGHCFWILERKSDHMPLGFCGLKRCEAAHPTLNGAFEIGWRLREDCWGQGYAKEAALRARDAAFTDFGACFLVSLTVEGNRASWGLMERLGLIRAPQYDYHDPDYSAELNPTIVYTMNEDQFSKQIMMERQNDCTADPAA